MGIKDNYQQGQTPLDEEEAEGLLIPGITTHEELNEFEQMNIEEAFQWALTRRLNKEKILSEEFVKELHFGMFNKVWKWAGEFRNSEKNLGIKSHLIGTALKQLSDDAMFWVINQTYTPEETAIQYKHRIVCIHCFANGNGRHSRLMADIIHKHIYGKEFFRWGGGKDLMKKGDQRNQYLKALKKADNGNIRPLIEFATS